MRNVVHLSSRTDINLIGGIDGSDHPLYFLFTNWFMFRNKRFKSRYEQYVIRVYVKWERAKFVKSEMLKVIKQ